MYTCNQQKDETEHATFLQQFDCPFSFPFYLQEKRGGVKRERAVHKMTFFDSSISVRNLFFIFHSIYAKREGASIRE